MKPRDFEDVSGDLLARLDADLGRKKADRKIRRADGAGVPAALKALMRCAELDVDSLTNGRARLDDKRAILDRHPLWQIAELWLRTGALVELDEGQAELDEGQAARRGPRRLADSSELYELVEELRNAADDLKDIETRWLNTAADALHIALIDAEARFEEPDDQAAWVRAHPAYQVALEARERESVTCVRRAS